MKTDLEIAQDQLELALQEIKNTLTVEQSELIYDYVFEAHRLVKKLTIPHVVGQSEQLKCHHQYMNAGILQGEAIKKCLKCGDYVKAL